MRKEYRIKKLADNLWQWSEDGKETHIATSRTKVLRAVIKRAVSQLAVSGLVVIIEQVEGGG